MKKLFSQIFFTSLIVMASVLIVLHQPTLLQAQDTTDPENTENSNDSVEEKLREILKKQANKVESVINDLTNQKHGFVGQVVRVSEETVALEVRGVTRILPLDETVAILKGTSEIEPEAIEIGNWATVLGVMDGDSFLPKQITLTATSPLPDPQLVYLGTIKDIKASSIDFQPRGEEEILTLDLTRNTVFQDNTGEEIDEDNFVEDDQVLLVGYQDDEDNIVTVIRSLAPIQDQ